MATSPAIPPFSALVDDHAAAVAAFLRGMLPAADAEDALQETFVAALRAYPGFDGANARAWLLTIARRKAIDDRRAAARRPEPLSEPDAVAADPGPAAGAEVWGRVAALPPKQRAAIVLRFGLDLRYREIGRALDCREAAARRNVHEGIKSLRSQPEIEEVRR